MKVAIEGFYGHGNLGDEAILSAFLKAFGHARRSQTVVFTTAPRRVRADHHVRAIHSRRSSHWRRGLEIFSSSVFLLGGGGLLKDYGESPDSLAGWLGNLTLAQRLKRSTALACVGVENIRFEDTRNRLRDVLEGVDDLTVRDGASLEILRDIGIQREIHVAADPALLLAETVETRRLDSRRPLQVMVSVRHWFSKGAFVEDEVRFARALESLASALRSVVNSRNAEVVLVPLRTARHDNDVAIADRVASMMACPERTRVLRDTPAVSTFIDMIDGCDLLVGMRLHSLILAATRGVPMVGLSYMPKVSRFMDSIGQTRFCMSLETVSPEQLIELMDVSITDYVGRSQAILEAVEVRRKTVEDALSRWRRLAGVSPNSS
jgi:polysaccharide pyruvyl transferase CsaB